MARGSEMTDWISIDDALPCTFENVLVCDAYACSDDVMESVIAFWDCYRWVSIAWWDYDLCSYPRVTHWQLLPAVPSIDKS